MASDLHRTAQPRTCYVPILGSAGAGRVGLAGAKYTTFYIFARALIIKISLYIGTSKKETMRNYNFLSIILLGITLASCSDTKK
jgi:hypothetical protein